MCGIKRNNWRAGTLKAAAVVSEPELSADDDPEALDDQDALSDELDDEGAEEGMESLPLSDAQHIMLQPDFLACAGELREHFDGRCAIAAAEVTQATTEAQHTG